MGFIFSNENFNCTMRLFFGLVFLVFSSNILSQDLAYFQPASSGSVIHKKYFSLAYSEEHEQALWVFYELSLEETVARVKRKNNFRSDPNIKSGSASLADYRGSGFDRGHLAPAGDMAFNKDAMSASFFMSNMSPQLPAFNRGRWKDLESQFRDWARADGSLFIVTGPVLKKGLYKIGVNGVSVPEQYYKIALDWDDSNQAAIAFLLPHKNISDKLENYIVSIDSIEALTGIDFFPTLDDDIERQIESELASFDFWRGTRIVKHETSSIESDNYSIDPPVEERPTINKYWLLFLLFIALLILLILVYKFRKNIKASSKKQFSAPLQFTQ
jgi:endonuclease G